jgi:hypothetical protein
MRKRRKIRTPELEERFSRISNSSMLAKAFGCDVENFLVVPSESHKEDTNPLRYTPYDLNKLINAIRFRKEGCSFLEVTHKKVYLSGGFEIPRILSPRSLPMQKILHVQSKEERRATLTSTEVFDRANSSASSHFLKSVNMSIAFWTEQIRKNSTGKYSNHT